MRFNFQSGTDKEESGQMKYHGRTQYVYSETRFHCKVDNTTLVWFCKTKVIYRVLTIMRQIHPVKTVFNNGEFLKLSHK